MWVLAAAALVEQAPAALVLAKRQAVGAQEVVHPAVQPVLYPVVSAPAQILVLIATHLSYWLRSNG